MYRMRIGKGCRNYATIQTEVLHPQSPIYFRVTIAMSICLITDRFICMINDRWRFKINARSTTTQVAVSLIQILLWP